MWICETLDSRMQHGQVALGTSACSLEGGQFRNEFSLTKYRDEQVFVFRGFWKMFPARGVRWIHDSDLCGKRTRFVIDRVADKFILFPKTADLEHAWVG